MMRGFREAAKCIYRLQVPFETLYTSVFLIVTPTGVILVDCATTDADVDGYIVPALREMGLTLNDIKALVLTHRHSDHAGGLSRVLSLAPGIEVIFDVRPLEDGLCVYPMAGHTSDCIGVLDTRTGTLITGDGLQGAGVGKYRCSVKDSTAYLETLTRIQNDQRIQNILFSHAYEPWYKDRITGRAEIKACLRDCAAYVS